MTNTAVNSTKEETTIIGILVGTDRRLKQWGVRPHPTKPGFTLHSYTLNSVDLPVADEMDLSLQFGADYHAKDAADLNNAIEKLKLLKADGYIGEANTVTAEQGPSEEAVTNSVFQQIAQQVSSPVFAKKSSDQAQLVTDAFDDQAVRPSTLFSNTAHELAVRSVNYWNAFGGSNGVSKCIAHMLFFHDQQPDNDWAEVHQNLNRFYAQAVVVYICSGLDLDPETNHNQVISKHIDGLWLDQPLYQAANAILYHFTEKYKGTAEFAEITLLGGAANRLWGYRFSVEFYQESLRKFFLMLANMMLSPSGEYVSEVTPPTFLNSTMQKSYRDAVAKLKSIEFNDVGGKSIHDVPTTDIKPGDKVDYDTELGNVYHATIQSITYFVDRVLIRIVIELGPDETRTARFEHGDGTKVTMR